MSSALLTAAVASIGTAVGSLVTGAATADERTPGQALRDVLVVAGLAGAGGAIVAGPSFRVTAAVAGAVAGAASIAAGRAALRKAAESRDPQAGQEFEGYEDQGGALREQAGPSVGEMAILQFLLPVAAVATATGLAVGVQRARDGVAAAKLPSLNPARRNPTVKLKWDHRSEASYAKRDGHQYDVWQDPDGVWAASRDCEMLCIGSKKDAFAAAERAAQA